MTFTKASCLEMCTGVRKEDWVLKKLFGSSIRMKVKSTLFDPAPEMASQYMPYRRSEVRNSLHRFKTKLETKHENTIGKVHIPVKITLLLMFQSYCND